MQVDPSFFYAQPSRMPEAVQLLTSILMRCPTIGAVRLTGGGAVIVFEFFLNVTWASNQYREFKSELDEAYHVFFKLSGINREKTTIVVKKNKKSQSSSDSFASIKVPKQQTLDFKSAVASAVSSEDKSYLDSIIQPRDSILVERDLASVTAEEICLLTSIFSQELSSKLITAEVFSDEFGFEDDEYPLAECLQNMRGLILLSQQMHVGGLEMCPDVIGYRDNMQIVVSAVSS